jgi:transcription-repair coupling factor (superfamily II helicase)
VPPEAGALLDVARVRAECVRTGVTEIAVTRSTGFGGPPLVARITPLQLPQSRQMRLERLYKGSVYKPDLAQVQIPVRAGSAMVDTLLEAFAQLVEPSSPAAAEAAAEDVPMRDGPHVEPSDRRPGSI